jgi:methyl halide transferase
MATQDKPNPERERLRQHFLNTSASDHPSKWDEFWKENYTPWDRETPNPALIDTLEKHRDIFGNPLSKDDGDGQKRKRALVPGCGKGYDVLLFAGFGYDALGLEVSETAKGFCERMKKERLGSGIYSARDNAVGMGEARFELANFFEKDWKGGESEGEWDVIYDYTVSTPISS